LISASTNLINEIQQHLCQPTKHDEYLISLFHIQFHEPGKSASQNKISVHSCIHPYMHSCIHPYMHTFYTFIHAYTCIYICFLDLLIRSLLATLVHLLITCSCLFLVLISVCNVLACFLHWLLTCLTCSLYSFFVSLIIWSLLDLFVCFFLVPWFTLLHWAAFFLDTRLLSCFNQFLYTLVCLFPDPLVFLFLFYFRRHYFLHELLYLFRCLLTIFIWLLAFFCFLYFLHSSIACLDVIV
jgi:hypothetical protein